MAIAGLSQALWLILAFPPLQLRFGTAGVMKLCAWLWPFFFALAPICNWFLRHGWRLVFWIVAPTGLVIGSGVAMAFSKFYSSAPPRSLFSVVSDAFRILVTKSGP